MSTTRRERPPERKRILDRGLYTTVSSTSRPGKFYHVYTGDILNSPHCTCESNRHGTRKPGVLFTCKHIRKAVFGEE